MKAEVSRGSNPAEGEVTTTGDPIVEMPVSPDGSNNGSPTLEVEGSQAEMGAGTYSHAHPTLLTDPIALGDVTVGRVRRSRRLRLPVIPGLSLDDRLGRLLLSIVLALLLWFYVLNLENPEQSTNFKGLTVELRGTADNLKVINPVPTVDSVVQAPQNIMATLNPADIRPYLDLSGLTEGVHEIPVRVDVTGGRAGAMQVNLSPRIIQVQLEAQVSDVYTVTAQTNGTPAFGHVLEPPQVSPDQIRITGSRDALSRITRVVAPVDVDERAGTQTGVRTPVALDETGKEITGLTFEPGEVEVTVPIKLSFAYKSVSIRVPVHGQPAPGYRVLDIKLNPTNVTACCSPEVLDPLQSLDTTPITITGATSTLTATTELILPEGVELYPGQKRTVEVAVSFERLVSTLQVSVAPTVEGLAEGFSAVVSPNQLDLVLSGTFEQIQSLRPADVRAVVSMQGRAAGTYELQPQIILPEGMTLESATPTRVTVTITAPTAVPPTLTATSTPSVQPTPLATQQATSAPPTQAAQSPTVPTVPTVTPQPTGTPLVVPPSPSPTATATDQEPDALPTVSVP